ncbi:chemotaxis protein CheB [Rubricoccus marinus]|uniref:PAS domain S-box protein n=1 Tax=Rubricoccus marinus TaxID=716817 RepID=A0A259U0H4_9BACT|nr:chemotaxis protein CheB [Rubricoccus marinus]OZC03324.1 hypothetical protein BSZ36_10230 [Rubricoccus marinus]
MASDLPSPSAEDSSNDETPAAHVGLVGAEEPISDDEAVATDFPVIGLGASAGGLGALSDFFDALPPQNEIALVIVQHLSPEHESELAEILQNHTFMRVSQVADTPTVRPGHVYVIPPGKTLTIRGGRLHLGEPARVRADRAPIDLFFRSLAEDLGPRSGAIVFSGTGADGAQGLARIKERGGLTMAQAPEEADFPSMPQAAIRTGLVDLVAPAAEMARRLIALRDQNGLVLPPEAEDATPDRVEILADVLRTLRSRTGHSFDEYKRSTLLRRIQRRIQVTDSSGMESYLQRLKDDRSEAPALLKDLLISVTNFFRDPEAFVALEHEAIVRIMASKASGDTVRAWVPGCATGEEAYTLAMLLCEHAPEGVGIQVFATDIDEAALSVARSGEYPQTIEADVSAERLRRFFEQTGSGYRIREGLRRVILFAPHNVLADPPFSRLDLVTCRNLLIYMQKAAQERVFQRFSYGLRAGGYLLLGSSETASESLFEAVDRRLRLYVSTSSRPHPEPRLYYDAASGAGFTAPPASSEEEQPLTPEAAYEAWTLQRHTPPRLLLNSRHEVTHVFGGAGRFLTEGEGRVTQDILSRVLKPFRPGLRSALHAITSGGRGTSEYVRLDDEIVRVHAALVDAPGLPKSTTEVVFEVLSADAADVLGAHPVDVGDEDPAVARLEAELSRAKVRLQESLEEHETSNEELRASNEELQSLNEELQSTTEELETSKEELQSMNEELITLNQELRTKVSELNQAYGDLVNLMQSTDIGTLFLDRELRVKRFTPKATDLFHLLPTDVGRPLGHIAHTLLDVDLTAEVERVLDTLQPVEQEVTAESGVYLLRVVPYRTEDDKIDGVVASFFNISARRRAEAEASTRADQQAAVAELGRLALEGTKTAGEIFSAACAAVCQTLGSDAAKVLEHRPDTHDLLLVEGQGWHDGIVGEAAVPDGDASQAGYTLLQEGPVIVRDYAYESRFESPTLLSDHGFASGISVVIPGTEGHPWGVLGTHSRDPRDFSERDALFLEAVANVLAASLRRTRDEERLVALAAEASRHAAEMEAVIEAIPDGIYIGDEEGVRHANSVALALVGVESLEELQGQTAEMGLKFNVRDAETQQPLAPEAYPFFRALHGETAAENILARNLTTDEDLYLRAAAAPVLVNGVTIGAVGVNTDISSLVELQKRVERREAVIAQQLAEITAVYDSLPIGLAYKDRDLRYVRINERLASINGLAPEAHLGRTTLELFPELGEMDTVNVQRVLDTGEPSGAIEYHIPAPGNPNEIRDWLTFHFPVTDASGDVIGVGTTVQDLTDMRQAETRLGESQRELASIEELYSATLDKLPTGVMVMDQNEDGKASLRYANPSAYAIVQGTPILAAPNRFADLGSGTIFSLDDRPILFDQWPLGRALRGEAVAEEEYKIPRQDGTWLHILISAAPVTSASGDSVSALAVFEDVTARRAAEDSVKALNENLEARVRQRTVQVRTLALALTLAEQRERARVAQILHDNVQQVLHGVRLRVEMLAADLSQDEAIRATEIETMVQNAIEITRSLSVDLAPPVLAGGGLDEALDWLAGQMQDLYKLKVNLQAVPLDPSPTAETITLLVQLVRELLFNVVKHAGVGEATVVVAQEDDSIRIDVIDHGQGFDPSETPFGFGLDSVQERVDLLSGSLDVASQPGGGTRSTLRLGLTVTE